MSIKSWSFVAFTSLSLGAMSCRSISGMQADVVDAATKGDLGSFRSYFTKDAQKVYGNQETMLKVASLAKENQEAELSQDHNFQWIDNKGSKYRVKATGLSVLHQKNGKTLWLSAELECEGTESISDGHPYAVDCKISKMDEPIELSISYPNAKLILLGHSCSAQKIKELIMVERVVNPNTALFPMGPTALSAIISRVDTDTGYYFNECEDGYRVLKSLATQIE